MTHRITNGHKLFRDNDLISFAYGVTGDMKGNPTFPEPPAALGDLEKILPEYQVAINKSSWGDEKMRFIRKALRTKVIASLAEVAEYVTLISNGDPAKLVSSGFQLNKAKGTKALASIKELKVTIDRTGEAVVEVKKVAGAKAYIHQYTTDPLAGENVWVNKVSTNPGYTFTGLRSKEKYWFQVIAIGLNGQETASPPVSRVIQ
jgi:hypothetical protein